LLGRLSRIALILACCDAGHDPHGRHGARARKRICEAKVPHVAQDTPILLKPNLGGFDWFKDPKKNDDGDDGVRGRIA